MHLHCFNRHHRPLTQLIYATRPFLQCILLCNWPLKIKARYYLLSLVDIPDACLWWMAYRKERWQQQGKTKILTFKPRNGQHFSAGRLYFLFLCYWALLGELLLVSWQHWSTNQCFLNISFFFQYWAWEKANPFTLQKLLSSHFAPLYLPNPTE